MVRAESLDIVAVILGSAVEDRSSVSSERVEGESVGNAIFGSVGLASETDLVRCSCFLAKASLIRCRIISRP